MFDTYTIARTRNMSHGEFPAVVIFRNTEEVEKAIFDAVCDDKKFRLILTVKPQGGQYSAYVFTFAALQKHAKTNVTGGLRLLVDEKHLAAYAEDPEIEKCH